MGCCLSRQTNNGQIQEDGGSIQVEYVTKEELDTIKKNAIRVGSTHDPYQRRYGYQRTRENYVGTMYCAKISNMKKEEDALLKSGKFEHNKHKRSNAKPIEGYVYAIVGTRIK